MLITTSRKPSQKTRTFARSLQRVLNADYVNRGKMNLRDVLIKAIQSDSDRILIISEMKGNPSRIEILNNEGNSLLSVNITASITSGNGRVEKNKLMLRCENESLRTELISILGLVDHESQKYLTHNSNLISIRDPERKTSRRVIEFYDRDGKLTGPKIYLQKCHYKSSN